MNNYAEKKRKYAFSALLSLIIPGLGQIIKGHVIKGSVIFLGIIICFISIIGLLLLPFIWIWNIYDAYTSNSEKIFKSNKEKMAKNGISGAPLELEKPKKSEEVGEIDIQRAKEKKQPGMAIINISEITDLTDGQFEEAEYEFKDALDFNPNDVEAELYLALCLKHKGKIV
ncbi:MAG: hypothetical protein P1P80_06280 [ANME-2 cluster archaeon]|nr:hypothetical protein [ANME-2 cluster archaeon]